MSEPLPALRSSAKSLDDLVSFYHQERAWVYQTRAEFHGGDDSEDENSSPPQSPPSPSLEAITRPSRRSSSPSSSSIRLVRRKKDLRTSLVVTSRDNVHSIGNAGVVPRHAARVLEIYDSIMESRMQSCHRINRLIRNANRVHLSRVTSTRRPHDSDANDCLDDHESRALGSSEDSP